MRKIDLSKSETAIVSDNTYKYLMNKSWYMKDGHAVRNESGRLIYMAKTLIPECAFMPSFSNGNKLDLRDENLVLNPKEVEEYLVGLSSTNLPRGVCQIQNGWLYQVNYLDHISTGKEQTLQDALAMYKKRLYEFCIEFFREDCYLAGHPQYSELLLADRGFEMKVKRSLPSYIYLTKSGRYSVARDVNGVKKSFGVYGSINQAKEVRKVMLEILNGVYAGYKNAHFIKIMTVLNNENRSPTVYLLSGILKCNDCEHTYSAYKGKYYRCKEKCKYNHPLLFVEEMDALINRVFCNIHLLTGDIINYKHSVEDALIEEMADIADAEKRTPETDFEYFIFETYKRLRSKKEWIKILNELNEYGDYNFSSFDNMSDKQKKKAIKDRIQITVLRDTLNIRLKGIPKVLLRIPCERHGRLLTLQLSAIKGLERSRMDERIDHGD